MCVYKICFRELAYWLYNCGVLVSPKPKEKDWHFRKAVQFKSIVYWRTRKKQHYRRSLKAVCLLGRVSLLFSSRLQQIE
jgi:hypothetical protein